MELWSCGKVEVLAVVWMFLKCGVVEKWDFGVVEKWDFWDFLKLKLRNFRRSGIIKSWDVVFIEFIDIEKKSGLGVDKLFLKSGVIGVFKILEKTQLRGSQIFNF